MSGDGPGQIDAEIALAHGATKTPVATQTASEDSTASESNSPIVGLGQVLKDRVRARNALSMNTPEATTVNQQKTEVGIKAIDAIEAGAAKLMELPAESLAQNDGMPLGVLRDATILNPSDAELIAEALLIKAGASMSFRAGEQRLRVITRRHEIGRDAPPSFPPAVQRSELPYTDKQREIIQKYLDVLADALDMTQAQRKDLQTFHLNTSSSDLDVSGMPGESRSVPLGEATSGFGAPIRQPKLLSGGGSAAGIGDFTEIPGEFGITYAGDTRRQLGTVELPEGKRDYPHLEVTVGAAVAAEQIAKGGYAITNPQGLTIL